MKTLDQKAFTERLRADDAANLYPELQIIVFDDNRASIQLDNANGWVRLEGSHTIQAAFKKARKLYKDAGMKRETHAARVIY